MSRKLSEIPETSINAVNPTLLAVHGTAGSFADARYSLSELVAFFSGFFIVASATVPTINLGAGAGAGATASIVRGNDNFFTIRITAGTGATTNAVVADILYGTAKSSVPNVQWSPGDVNSNGIVGSNQSVLIHAVDANKCRITSGGSGLSNGASYIWTVYSL